MATITTNRKELFHIINEVTKELRKKIDTHKLDDELEEVHMGAGEDNTVKWTRLNPEDPEENSGTLKESSHHGMSHGFGHRVNQGMLIGTSYIKIHDVSSDDDNYVPIPIVIVGTRAEGKEVILRTNLRWYDHLRPSVIKMKRLVEYARAQRVSKKSIAIEHHLAKIVPDRLDKILLEGDSGAKSGNN